MTSLLQPHPPVRALSALIVDDDTFMLEFIADLLRGLGARDVATAKNGQEGCAAFDRRPTKPDVVVCDLAMPGTDGFQFMELLAKRNYKGGVIIASGTDSRTLQSASLMGKFHRLNFLGCLAKPISSQALAQALGGLA